uniref:Tudor domain-containing protein n=1 Tax=Glossina austeni TaxID=7395 RepID=A0A1A9VI41_GLOAU
MHNKINIAVTHFINPHLFWYRNVHDFHELNQIEQQLQTWKNTARDIAYHPKLGEKVAVSFVAWNKVKVVRAEILCEVKWLNEFIVWALDYGFPFRTKIEFIHQLPKKMMRQINHIHCGGLANILPGENEYDYVKGKSSMIKKDNWTQRVCDILEKLLITTHTITFVEEFQSRDGRHWGNLMIVNHKGQVFNAREHLLSAHHAVAIEKFEAIALKLKTINVQRFLSNSGKLTTRTNIIRGNMGSYCKIQKTESAIYDFVKRKVEDWYIRNKRDNHMIDAMLKPSVERMKPASSTNVNKSVPSIQQSKEMSSNESTIPKINAYSYEAPVNFQSSSNAGKRNSPKIENVNVSYDLSVNITTNQGGGDENCSVVRRDEPKRS